MDRLVVDASVLTAFFLGEEGSEDIEIILDSSYIAMAKQLNIPHNFN